MSEWKEVIATDFCVEVTDGTHDSPKPVSKGRYLLTSKHLQEYQLDFANAYQISQEDYEKAIARSKVDQYDVLFSMIGTIGITHRVSMAKVDFAVKNMGIFKMGGDEIKSMWLYYWLKTRKAKEYINSTLSGTTQGYITLKALRNFPIQVPNEGLMKSITSFLSSLDDKIAVNRRICENLEAQAQALFKHWFIDFAPFKNGNFVESELGMIPEGWRVGKLGDYCKVKSGFAFKSSMWTEKGCPVIKIKNITNSGRIDMTDCSYISKQNVAKAKAFKANRGDLVIAMTGATIGKFSILPQFDDETYINQRVGKFFLGNNPLEKLPYVFCLLSDNRNRKQLTTMGQGSAQPNISGSDIESIIAVYSNNVIESFNEICYPMFDMILTKQEENLRLSTLRDTLLPKLMSGQIKV